MAHYLIIGGIVATWALLRLLGGERSSRLYAIHAAIAKEQADRETAERMGTARPRVSAPVAAVAEEPKAAA